MCNYCFVVLTIPLCLVIVNKFYSILFYNINDMNIFTGFPLYKFMSHCHHLSSCMRHLK